MRPYMPFESKICIHIPKWLTIYIDRLFHIIQLPTSYIFIEFLPGLALCSNSVLIRGARDWCLYAIEPHFMHRYTFSYPNSFHHVFFASLFFYYSNAFLNRKYVCIVQNIQGIKTFMCPESLHSPLHPQTHLPQPLLSKFYMCPQRYYICI